MTLIRTAAIGLIIFAAGTCAAKPPFLRVFLATYKVNPNSELGRARCLTCHRPPGPPDRNPYGVAVREALHAANARMITFEMLKSIEKLDLDGDHFSNIAEIRAGTLPGDAKSTPKKKGRKGKKKAAMVLPDAGGAVVFLLPSLILGLVRRTSRSD